MEEEKTQPIFEAKIRLLPKSERHYNKKKIEDNISDKLTCKNLNKILANQMQQYIFKITHHDQVRFIPEMQEWFHIHKSANVIHHENKMKNKYHIVISMMAEKKGFDKI